MKLHYVDFWPGFDVNCNWFNLLFKYCFLDRNISITNNPNEADVIIGSCFGNNIDHITNKCTKIIYLGENIRPDNYLSKYDYALCFDIYSSDKRIFRLPHWWLYINWWNEPNFPHATISLDQLNNNWNLEQISSRKKFCAIIIGNPVPNRLQCVSALNKYLPVDCFGKAFNNVYTGDKVELLTQYRWNICFENAIYPGYITEKLLQARVAGCLPIYYGDDTVTFDFNKFGFLHYNKCSSLESLVDLIKFMDSNYEMLYRIVKQPYFYGNVPSLTDLYYFLRNC